MAARAGAARQVGVTVPGVPGRRRAARCLRAGGRGDPTRCRGWVPARPRRPRPLHPAAPRPAAAQLPQQPDGRSRATGAARTAPRRWHASTTSCWPATRPTRSWFSGHAPSQCAAAGRPKQCRCVEHALKALVDAGVPSGFVAGDPRLDRRAEEVPPERGRRAARFVQLASIAAWDDEAHVEEVRARYRHKRDLLWPALQAARLPRRRRSCHVLPVVAHARRRG